MLDSNTHYNFEKELNEENFPSCEALISFVEKKCHILQINSISNNKPEPLLVKPRGERNNQRLKVQSLVTSTQKESCILCTRPHRIIYCPQFLKLSPKKRFERIKRLNICFNCLSVGHRGGDCPSSHSCKTCQARHHSLIHFIGPKKSIPTTGEGCNSSQAAKNVTSSDMTEPQTQRTGETSTASYQASVTSRKSDVLLGTVQLLIRDAFGLMVPFRAILDSGSQRSFLSESFVKRLGFQPLRSNILVTGIGSSPPIPSKGTIMTIISSRLNNKLEIQFSAQILPSLTNHVPQAVLPTDLRKQFCNLDLADSHFDVPGEINGILGIDIVVKSLLEHQPLLKSSPAALSTIFGFVIMGPLPSTTSAHLGIVSLLTREPIPEHTHELSSVLKGFWESEEPTVKVPQTSEDAICERHFVETHSRNASGRYIVRLPFRSSSTLPSNNRQLALNRWNSQERRFARNSDYEASYNGFLEEYMNLGHMKPTLEPSKYTIPHHAVYKLDSTTTKVRIVFDASAKQIGDLSLNQCLLSGPILQPCLADIVCNFRRYAIGFTADISKMYWQILIHPDDQSFQHIIWRRTRDGPLETFALQTVTYGVISAPFLAIRTLLQLAQDEGKKFPNAARILQEDIYVDDIVSGANSEEEAFQLYQELTALCSSGGFELQKWSSNCSSFVEAVSSQVNPDSLFPLVSDSDTTLKILGVQWNPSSDVFTYTFNSLQLVLTKRGILSDIARLFDPLGWISPVVFSAKYLLQTLWRLKLEWDEVVPEHHQHYWKLFVAQLPLLNQIRIPRYVLLPDASNCHILGFCDASEAGYSCAIYVRTSDIAGNIIVRLLKARTKVAPLQSLTIPRLELCGALLLVRTLVAMKNCLIKFPSHSIHLWTDSTIVLSWLELEPANLKVFVAHRIAEINQSFPKQFWGHVPSNENPSDPASRGLLPKEIVGLDIWWNGPFWARLPPGQWPGRLTNENSYLPELKKTSALLSTSSPSPPIDLLSILERFSSLSHLNRVFAWILRFRHNLNPRSIKVTGPLHLWELRKALLCCVRLVQGAKFSSEISDLNSHRPLRRSFLSLSPFIDSSGLLRVGGRLSNSELSWSEKHPLLLPKTSHLTRLIVKYFHEVYLHVGPQTLQSLLNRDYWIISGRSLIRQVVRTCSVCFRFRHKAQVPLMGELPSCRVTPPGRAFVHVGVDFAGPILIRTSRLRKAAVNKAYICVFVCMATEAVHIELVSSLSTEAFLACLDRFMSRRGAGQHFYSDQGRNFIGASRQLKEIQHFVETLKDPAHEDQLNRRNVTWHFIPPFSPNFGGLWEASVKAVKTHLVRLMDCHPFTFEELCTILAKIEAILNSRPLCPLSSDPNDFIALTPGHFLVGGPLNALPETSLADVSMNRLKRWQLVQRITQAFWRRWSSEYLHTLQQRSKWSKGIPNLEVGDLVLLKNSSSSALQWTTSRIVSTHPGQDGIVRVVTVRTPLGEYKRPVSALVPFPQLNH